MLWTLRPHLVRAVWGGEGGDIECGECSAARVQEEAEQPHEPQLPAPAAVAPALPVSTRFELRRGDGDDDAHCWHALSGAGFDVRGQSYLQDGKKVASADVSEVLGIEFFRSAVPVHNAAGRPDSPIASLAQRSSHRLAHVVVINLMIPATDGGYQLVFYFGIREVAQLTPGSRLLQQFVTASDAFRSARLKLIPSIADGPWLVKKAVGARPSILGKSLRLRYFRTPVSTAPT